MNSKEEESDSVNTGQMSGNINESVNKRFYLEEKIEKLLNNDKAEPKQMTYTDITKEELKTLEANIRSFMKEEKEEEHWLNSTKCNIILHNFGENEDETKEEQQGGNKRFIEQEV